MEKTYTHYGVEVRKIYADEDIDCIINDHKAVLMPITEKEFKVAYYKHDGIHTTYLVIPRGRGSYYVTTQIPKDLDFKKLIMDIDAQDRGEEPVRMESYIHALYCKIEKDVYDAVDWSSVNDDGTFKDETCPLPLEDIKVGFADYGICSLEDITNMAPENYWDWDVDLEYMKKIFES